MQIVLECGKIPLSLIKTGVLKRRLYFFLGGTIMTTESEEYGLHVVLAREMRTVLKDAAELAYRMGDIPRPSIAGLMDLFIGWGLSVQKKKWLNHMGYR